MRWRSTEVICSGDVSERWRSRIKFGVCGDRARSAINVVPHRKAGAVLGGLLGPGLPLAPYGAGARSVTWVTRNRGAQAAASHRPGSKRFRIHSSIRIRISITIAAFVSVSILVYQYHCVSTVSAFSIRISVSVSVSASASVSV